MELLMLKHTHPHNSATTGWVPRSSGEGFSASADIRIGHQVTFYIRKSIVSAIICITMSPFCTKQNASQSGDDTLQW